MAVQATTQRRTASQAGIQSGLWRWLRRGGLKKIIIALTLVVFIAWTLVPLAWIVITALKPTREIFTPTALLPSEPTFDHFSHVWNNTDFPTYLRNSLIVATATTVVSMTVALLAAYALTRLDFFGRRFIARSAIVTYLIPGSLLFIPLFQVAHQFKLTDKALGLVVIYLIFAVPFSTWLAISYFNTIPAEIEDAALVDGANRLQVLWTVTIPLALPALAVVALFTFTQAWNEFLFALLLISRDSQKTMPVGLAEFVIGDVFQWGPLMAGALIAAVPPLLIYTIAQRWVVSGLAGGAIKG